MIKDAQWAEDKEAAECRQCTKQFSVSRRRVRRKSFSFSAQVSRGTAFPDFWETWRGNSDCYEDFQSPFPVIIFLKKLSPEAGFCG